MRSFVAIVGLGIGLIGLVACEDEPCNDYVDYMCSCHDGEEGFDCAELRATLSGAEPAVQDQCSLDLSEQQADDDSAGVECEL